MIILGSQSPRRQELLKRIVPNFTVHPVAIDERALPLQRPQAYVASLAAAKGAALAQQFSADTLITADTMVAFHDQLLGKPKDRRTAFDMLQRLSGQTHQVYTGLWVQQRGRIKEAVVKTDVTFWPLTQAQINAYLDTNEYQDKAGAYGIQAQGALLVKGITGDFYNVVGLPISTLARMLI